MRLNRTSDWTAYIDEIVKSINDSKHRGLYGLIPSHVNNEDGNYVIQRFRQEFGPPEDMLNSEGQENLKKAFYKKNSNKLFKVGALVMPDVDISRKIIKSYHPKVSSSCQLKEIIF